MKKMIGAGLATSSDLAMVRFPATFSFLQINGTSRGRQDGSVWQLMVRGENSTHFRILIKHPAPGIVNFLV